MSRRVLRRTRSSLDYIERMVNKTTLHTQQIAHRDVIGLGTEILSQIVTVKEDDRDKAITEVVEAAEQRATRELCAALKRQKNKLDNEKNRSVESQKEFYQKLSEKVQQQRDRLEKERLREMERKYDKDIDDALVRQREEMLREKEEAVKAAVDAAKKNLYEELSNEHKSAIQDALQKQAALLEKEKLAKIEKTMLKCALIATEMAGKVAQQHKEEITSMKQSYKNLEEKYMKELDHKLRVEDDFLALQSDYKRFLDYTDGYYHSDFMMKLKHHGTNLANKRVSVVSYTDLRRPSNTNSFKPRIQRQ